MLQQFLPAIQTLPTDRAITKQDLVTASFFMEKDGELDMYYAPHNEHINHEAKIVIVGITPGWNQMRTAFEQFIKRNESGDNLERCLKEAKKAAGFAGAMRTNLTHMLDQCDIPQILDIPDSSCLFGDSRHLLHTTSIIKYPVFFKGSNYTGHQPPIDRSLLLQRYAYKEFPEELTQMEVPALVIPLGKVVEQVIFKLAKEEMLPGHYYLSGFPHPSGANGHRIKQFEQNRERLREKVKAWSDGKG